MKRCLFTLVLALVFAPSVARADISLLVLESMGFAGEFTGSGHTGVYLSNICADGPVRLRLCEAGERGVVISSYPGFGSSENYEWMAMPLVPYLYGVENERDIPLYANGRVRDLLRETYRRNHLRSLIPDSPNGTMPEGRWGTMIAVTLNREIYSLNMETTPEEDARFLQEFNSLPNTGNFNSFSRNCADFSRMLINRYFPGATGRDVINDFGITTPKALARRLTNYASRRPERLFHINKYTQVSGTIWRSYDNRNFTEMALTSRKYLIPTLVFYPPLLPIFAGAYLTTGRFNLHQTYRNYASPQIAQLNLERQLLRDAAAHTLPDRATRLRSVEQRIANERSTLLGNRQSWDAYRANFNSILRDAIARGLFQDSREVRSFFRDLELQSDPAFGANGALILRVRYYGEERTLGITRGNIMSENSDRELALKLMLAKINADLNARERDRHTLEEFRADWELMRQLLASYPMPSGDSLRAQRNGRRFLEVSSRRSIRNRLRNAVITITH
jgi:hypothetical protein